MVRNRVFAEVEMGGYCFGGFVGKGNGGVLNFNYDVVEIRSLRGCLLFAG